jgi:transposase-like protein
MARSRKRRRYTRDEIDALLEEFDRSGLSQIAFARRRGLSHSTFRWWLRHRRPRAARPRFLPVAVADGVAAPVATPVVLELELGGERRLHIPVDVEPEALRTLLPILIAAC